MHGFPGQIWTLPQVILFVDEPCATADCLLSVTHVGLSSRLMRTNAHASGTDRSRPSELDGGHSAQWSAGTIEHHD